MKTVQTVLTDGLWTHIGALVAIGIGVADVFLLQSKGFGVNADEFFIIGGLAAFGVNITNNTLAK